MKPSRLPSMLSLERNQLVRLRHACGTRITARAGMLWITVDREPQDVVLEAGDSYVVQARAPVIVQALDGAATARFDARTSERACRSSWAERLRHALRTVWPQRAGVWS